MESRGERSESPTHSTGNACTRLSGSLMKYMVVARAAEKLSWRRRTMIVAADRQPRRTQERCLRARIKCSRVKSNYWRQVRFGSCSGFHFGKSRPFPNSALPPGAEIGETARDRRSADSEACPKIARTLRTRRNFSSLRATASLGHASTVRASAMKRAMLTAIYNWFTEGSTRPT
jgi:hypothetical protein